MLALVLSAFLFGLALADPDLGRECKPGEKGSPGIKYFVDFDRNTIYSFYYKGCGGNGNRYDDEGTARMLIPIDHSACPGWPKVDESCFVDDYPEHKPCKKPGYVCKRLGISLSGSCCHKATGERFRENRKASCPDGMKAHTIKMSDWEMPLFGRKCAHNFCPSGTKCIDGEFEAYCCKK